MKNAPRFVLLLFAIVAVVVILTMWKKQDRARALEELETRFDAEISITDEEFYVGCSSERLSDLVEFSKLVERVGEPKVLDVTGAPNLESFAGVQELISLESLVAIDCPKLTSAEGVATHPGLAEIVLTDCFAFGDASAVRDLPALETLDLSGCRELTSIDVSTLPALRNLYLSRCREISNLDVTACPELRQLYLDGCAGLDTIVGLGRLGELTDLDVSNATGLSDLEGVGDLEKLVVLDVRNVALSSFDEIGSLPSLRVLRMGGQGNLETLEPFTGLPELREIHLEACANLRSLEGMPPTVSQYAGFTHCPRLESLDGVEAAAKLEQLDLTGCENLSDVSALAELRQLVQLNLVKCRQVTDISPVEKLENLVIVILGGSGVVAAAVEKLEPANEDVIFDFAVSE